VGGSLLKAVPATLRVYLHLLLLTLPCISFRPYVPFYACGSLGLHCLFFAYRNLFPFCSPLSRHAVRAGAYLTMRRYYLWSLNACRTCVAGSTFICRWLSLPLSPVYDLYNSGLLACGTRPFGDTWLAAPGHYSTVSLLAHGGCRMVCGRRRLLLPPLASLFSASLFSVYR